MIELPVQTSLTTPPGLPEPAISAEFEATGFAAQLAQMVEACPVTDSTLLPPSGKTLPPVIEPNMPADPLGEPEAVALPKTTAPIMRPTTPIAEAIALDTPIVEPEAVPLTKVAVPIMRVLPGRNVAKLEAKADGVSSEDRPAEIAVPAEARDELQPAFPNVATAAPTLSRPAIETAINQAPAPTAEISSVPIRPAAVGPADRLAATAKSNHPLRPESLKLLSQFIGLDRAFVSLPTKSDLVAGSAVAAAQTVGAVQVSRPVEGRRRETNALAAVAATNIAKSASMAAVDLPPLPTADAGLPTRLVAEISASRPVLPTTAATASPPTTPPVQDFAALIERIVVAREASGAPVAVAVRHAEFGAVTLRLEHGDSGPNITASSPDPDFARAAAAALPAERSTSAETSPRDSGRSAPQSDQGSHGNASGQSRNRAAASAWTMNSNPANQPATASEARDSGIFA